VLTGSIEQRLFDLIIALSALLLLAPIMAIIALLVRLKLGAPVFFRQSRPGLHGKPFRMIKLRTMTTRVTTRAICCSTPTD
jgi:lipopolysaccharide/colanic/teichoic acid biosynthesis glycosyltransferase